MYRSVVGTYFTSRDISVFGEGISIKLGTNIHHVSGHCWKYFQGNGFKGQRNARARRGIQIDSSPCCSWHKNDLTLAPWRTAWARTRPAAVRWSCLDRRRWTRSWSWCRTARRTVCNHSTAITVTHWYTIKLTESSLFSTRRITPERAICYIVCPSVRPSHSWSTSTKKKIHREYTSSGGPFPPISFPLISSTGAL